MGRYEPSSPSTSELHELLKMKKWTKQFEFIGGNERWSFKLHQLMKNDFQKPLVVVVVDVDVDVVQNGFRFGKKKRSFSNMNE